MTTLQRLGVISLLRKSRELLKEEFPEDIANDCYCTSCHARGMGTSTKHAPACETQILIADLQRAYLELEMAGDPT